MATQQQYIGYDNIVTIGNITADSSISGYPATNAANPATNLKWKSDSTAAQYVTITNTASAEIDYVGIAAHNLSSSGCTVDIQVQATSNGSWVSALSSPFTVTDDRPILKTFVSSTPYAIRLKITPSGSIKPYIGVIYAGSITQLQRGVYVGHTPITYSRDVSEVNGMAENGDFLGRIVRQTSYASAIRISNMTPAWYRETFEPFVIACATKPFFYAWRKDEYADEVGYCWTSGGVPVPENSGPGALMSISFKIGGQA
ncbi:MAG: hypothetical protein HGB02_03670 [Chlorobiaceae bacterium]|nr:hypothetical protein [Chlorobiaceae bacterium]